MSLVRKYDPFSHHGQPSVADLPDGYELVPPERVEREISLLTPTELDAEQFPDDTELDHRHTLIGEFFTELDELLVSADAEVLRPIIEDATGARWMFTGDSNAAVLNDAGEAGPAPDWSPVPDEGEEDAEAEGSLPAPESDHEGAPAAPKGKTPTEAEVALSEALAAVEQVREEKPKRRGRRK